MVLNVRAALDAADTLASAGLAPFIPHLTHFWHLVHPRPYEFWLHQDNQWIPCCDALLRLPGPSSGADKEMDLAQELGLPIFHDIPSVLAAYGDLTLPDCGA